MPINVVLAEKQKIVREALKFRLEAERDVKVVGETDNGYECLNLISKYSPNVIVMDTDLNSLDGVKVLGIMREQELRSRVLFLTASEERATFKKALENGCDGYITKNVDYAELKKAVYTLYKGDKYFEANLKNQLRDKSDDSSQNELLSTLTKRELEILKLLSNGLTNKEISASFNISDRTVKNHIFSIFKKLNVSDRTQAAVYAIKHGLVNMNIS